MDGIYYLQNVLTNPEQRGSFPVVHDRPCHPHVPAVDAQFGGVGGDQLVDDVAQPGQALAAVDHQELVVLPGGERDEDVSSGDGQAQPEGQVELHRVLPVVTAGGPLVGGSGGEQLAEVALVTTAVQVQVEVRVDLDISLLFKILFTSTDVMPRKISIFFHYSYSVPAVG